MKRNIKLKGRLRNYMYWPMILTILLAVFNVPVYMINTKSGCVVTVFTVIYFIVVCLSYNYNKPVLVNELISFATQYGSAQKKLLEEFEIPYRTVTEWERGTRNAPKYVLKFMEYYIQNEKVKKENEQKVSEN